MKRPKTRTLGGLVWSEILYPWMIRGIRERDDDGTPLYWSNEFGWVERGQADVFSRRERRVLNLPIGGEWVSTNYVPEEK